MAANQTHLAGARFLMALRNKATTEDAARVMRAARQEAIRLQNYELAVVIRDLEWQLTGQNGSPG